MTQVRIIDTTLRDGQQSLWALGMSTSMMLPTLEGMDEAGFDAMEFFVPVVQLKKMIRDLGENPWDWLKLGTTKVKKTPLRLHGGYTVGISKVPESVARLMVKQAIDRGITTTRTSHPWNDFEFMKDEVEGLRKMGMNTVVNLIYSESPRHTDEYYVERSKAAAKLGAYRICFKDVGGLLKPERIRQLLPKILGAIGDNVVEFHAHCNNGLAPLNIMEAVKLGVKYVHTAIPPLANGSSQPNIFNIEKNLRAIGYEPDVNVSVLKQVEEYLNYVAKREKLPVGEVYEYDETLYNHQVPGGMISNLRFQLAKVGMENRLDETLKEAAQVRADLGYPIMVTPLSQFVGSQAGVNIVAGERYKVVIDEIIQYALGIWGEEAVEVMDQDVRAKILDRPRARELAKWKPPIDMSLKEVRKIYGENLTDEELVLRIYIDEDAVNIARNAPTPQPYLSSSKTLAQLVKEIARINDKSSIFIQRGDFSLALNT